MAGANLRKIMGEMPRALEVISHDDKDQQPIGRKKLGPKRIAQKQGDYIARVLTGERPLDDDAADAIRDYVGAFHARHR